jgi:hypothetical protein
MVTNLSVHLTEPAIELLIYFTTQLSPRHFESASDLRRQLRQCVDNVVVEVDLMVQKGPADPYQGSLQQVKARPPVDRKSQVRL